MFKFNLKINNNKPNQRRRSMHRRGAATVEAAIILPILIAVSLGSTDVAQYINLAQTVTNASRQGSRFACRDATESVADVESAVRTFFQQSFPNASSEVLNAAIEVSLMDENGCAIPDGDLSNIESGQSVSVEVDFDFDSVRWFKGLDYLGSDVSRSISVGRRE